MPAACSTMILRSLRLTGEKRRGDTLTSNEQTECLAELNAMLESWANERLMIHTVFTTSFSLTASQGSYTIGSGGNFNMTRPTKVIDPCYIRDSSGNDTKLKIISAETYGMITDKDSDGSYPEYVFYDYSYSATSTARIYFWPEPQTGLTAFLSGMQPFTNFSTMTHNLSLPPGYQRAIEYNYAIEAAGGLTEVDPQVAMVARESKAALKRLNAPSLNSQVEWGTNPGQRLRIISGP